MTNNEDPRIVVLQKSLEENVGEEVSRIRANISKTMVPRAGRVLALIKDWDQTIETDSGLIFSTDYIPDQHERREGNQATNQTLNGTLIEVSTMAQEEGYRVGMNVVLLKPESLGYSTKITIPSKKGDEVFTLYILHYGDILSIITEEHTSNK